MAKPKDRKRAPAREPGLVVPPTKSVPKKQLDVLPERPISQLLIIRFDSVDFGGPWSITAANREHLAQIFKAVASFESMTVGEAFNGEYPGVDYVIDEMPKPAKDRLAELDLDDQDKISRLRLGNKPRLYGFRRGRFFHVLWWDPEHLVVPSKLKHT